ncbi:hypothetical protein HK099_003068 [Clydaea vesicula]|uniref:Cation-transporting P-type ATPase N-terminal domain-containing protein n=1 Tax=Clydaea vesicula TaxID=447962 RepID=A0AAD5U5B0_9FUNG|nr:hypothetical protein HK099_003068 [Clydaea vesicula]
MSNPETDSPSAVIDIDGSNQKTTQDQPASKTAKKTSKNLDIDEHLLSFEEIQEKWTTQFNPTKPPQSLGLHVDVAAARLTQYGRNVLTPASKTHPFILYLKCLSATFNLLLVLCAIFTWILLIVDPVANFSSNMIPANCSFVRDGNVKQSPASELVPGDIVHVRTGDKIPADIYIFAATDFKVDNSSLTGEAEPQERTNRNTHENPLEATNLAFNGTLAVSGDAYGVVVRTGDSTVLGQIANLTQGESKRESPLSQEITKFVGIISFFAISTAIIFFIVAYLNSTDKPTTGAKISYALNFAIGVLVAWVPQGLPSTVSMLLTIAAKRMATKQVLVKDLQGVETLGAITLLATDKTGTLTRNQMTVTYLWTSLKMVVAESNSESILNPPEVRFDRKISGIEEIINISALCSKARFDRTDVPVAQRVISADATESGLFRFAANKLGDTIDNLEEMYPKVFEIPFNSENKWAMTIHKKSHQNGELSQFIKGAPERILRICSHILVDEALVEMTEEHKNNFTEAYETMAGKGHRVLAFAQNLLDGQNFPADFVFDKEKKNFPTTGLCFVGLTSLEDPPKHGVREAVGHCREAGVKVMMVTGDHPLTAEAIGRKINMMLSDTKERLAKRTNRSVESIGEDEYHAIVIHGERIDSLTDAEWDLIFSKDEIIFARTSPKHKLQIVKHAQSLGHIVGVTGDGVNDSPALKKADLGIAMNISGSDVSKEAAAMILLDDNFASTVNGIREGRLIFFNLKKSIKYVISHSIPEILPFIFNVAIPIPLALNALQVLVIDLGFEIFAALSYAWEPAESEANLMRVPPRKPVTSDSIKQLKERNLRYKDEVDRETGEPIKRNFLQYLLYKLRRPFTRNFWLDFKEKKDGEILVDVNVLSWAYLEAGVIETVGCFTAFYFVLFYSVSNITNKPYQISFADSMKMTSVQPEQTFTTSTGRVLTWYEQQEVIARGQSIYYFGIMIIQMFNLFACKCRTGYPFGIYPLRNMRTWGSLVAGVLFASLIVYTPPFNVAFNTSYMLEPVFWVIPIIFGFILLIYASIRRLIQRKFFPEMNTTEIEGLLMYPTRFSTGSKH